MSVLNILFVLVSTRASAGALPPPEMICYDGCVEAGKSRTRCLSECGYVKQESCQNVKAGPFDPTINVDRFGFYYEVSKSGQSRNTYAAGYYPAGTVNTRIGTETTLKKTADYSTWKDMPDSLVLKESYFDGPVLHLEGLTEGSVGLRCSTL